MKCKNCIHYDICAKQNKLVQIDEHTWDEFVEIDNVEDYCSYFKYKYNFVRVVRCSECKYSQKGKSIWGITYYNCSITNDTDLDEDDYCSNGKCRVTGG